MAFYQFKGSALFKTEEGKNVFIAQRTIDSWLNNIQTEQGALYEEEHKARCEAEREREEERRGREAAERGREAAERGREAAEHGREEDRVLYLERQKRMIVRIFNDKYGADAQLPENWADGRSSDDLEELTIKIYESDSLKEALAAFEK